MLSKIFPIVAVLIAVALFFLYISPTYSGKIASDRAQIQSYESALSAANAFSQKETELTNQENSISAAGIKRLGTSLPDGVNNVQLILDLNSLASNSGITLSDFDVEGTSATSTSSGGGTATAAPSGTGSTDTSPSGGTSTGLQSTSLTGSLDISLTASGTYNAFRTFMAATEQSLRVLDMTQVAVADSGTGVYTYHMTFRIYWLR